MELSRDTTNSAYSAPGVIEESYGLYPGLASFSSDYDSGDYRGWVEQSNGDPLPAPLALYIQEFSGTAGSSSRVTNTPASLRLAAISRELDMQGALFDSDRPLQQLVLSGSIITQWTDDQLHHLMAAVQGSFPLGQSSLSSNCACVGPTIPDEGRLRILRTLGFNGMRFSFTNRAELDKVLDELGQSINCARQSGFRQVVLDLPRSETHTETASERMQAWLAEVRPDRIRYIGNPVDSDRSYVQTLSGLGYQNIGLGWYALANDPFVQAQAAGLLHWSPLGFTDMPSPDVIGVGPGAISSIGEFYGRNESDLKVYQSLLNDGHLPIVCGIELEADDVLRREIMIMILTASSIRITAIEDKWGIRFAQFFASETEQLRAFEQKNWLDWQQDRIRIQVRGYRELTKICRIFDRRARAQVSPSKLSSF